MLFNKRFFAVFFFTLLASSNINASGFSVAEHSASGMGSAFAGASAIAEDASTTYFNPAGLSKLKGKQMIFAAHYVSVSSAFTNNGSTSLTTAPLGGANDDGSTSPFIPNFYYSRELNSKWNFGFGINVPLVRHPNIQIPGLGATMRPNLKLQRLISILRLPIKLMISCRLVLV